MNTIAEVVGGKSPQEECFKIEMLLKEAELFQHDINFISLTKSPRSLDAVLHDWVANEDNLHTGKLTVYAKSSFDGSRFSAHEKLNLKRISDNLKLRNIEEIILIGREVVIILAGGDVGIFRDKRHVDSVNRIIKSTLRISLIELQKETA
jgi:hypothetical protein